MPAQAPAPVPAQVGRSAAGRAVPGRLGHDGRGGEHRLGLRRGLGLLRGGGGFRLHRLGHDGRGRRQGLGPGFHGHRLGHERLRLRLRLDRDGLGQDRLGHGGGHRLHRGDRLGLGFGLRRGLDGDRLHGDRLDRDRVGLRFRLDRDGLGPDHRFRRSGGLGRLRLHGGRGGLGHRLGDRLGRGDRLRGPRGAGLRRDLGGRGHGGLGGLGADVQVLGARGRGARLGERDGRRRGAHGGRRGGLGGRRGRAAVGEGPYDSAVGLGHGRAHVQGAPHGGRGGHRGGGRRDDEPAEVERAGVTAARLVRARAVAAVGEHGRGELGVRGRGLGVRGLGAEGLVRVRLRLAELGRGEGRGLRDDLRVAPGTLAARHQQQFLVLRLGRIVHEVLEGVAGGNRCRDLDRSGDALLIHHARVVRETLARDLAGVSHAYPSPIGFASSIARSPTRPPSGFACGVAVRRARLACAGTTTSKHCRARRPP